MIEAKYNENRNVIEMTQNIAGEPVQMAVYLIDDNDGFFVEQICPNARQAMIEFLVDAINEAATRTLSSTARPTSFYRDTE